MDNPFSTEVRPYAVLRVCDYRGGFCHGAISNGYQVRALN